VVLLPLPKGSLLGKGSKTQSSTKLFDVTFSMVLPAQLC
jgi:hypothetical protein